MFVVSEGKKLIHVEIAVGQSADAVT